MTAEAAEVVGREKGRRLLDEERLGRGDGVRNHQKIDGGTPGLN